MFVAIVAHPALHFLSLSLALSFSLTVELICMLVHVLTPSALFLSAM